MLITDPNIAAPDAFYEALIDAHRGLTEEERHRLNARLILLLANHIGDLTVLRAALSAGLAHHPDHRAPPPLAGGGREEG